jgi:hypothetical protein
MEGAQTKLRGGEDADREKAHGERPSPGCRPRKARGAEDFAVSSSTSTGNNVKLDHGRKNMRIIFLVALCLSVTISRASADWAYTKWGMTADQVAKASGGSVKLLTGAEQQAVSPNMRHEAEGTYSDGGVPLQVKFTFDPTNGNGLNCVFYAVTDTKDAAALKDLMLKRYGPPSQEGGLFGISNLTWNEPDQITLQISDDDPAFVTHCKKN